MRITQDEIKTALEGVDIKRLMHLLKKYKIYILENEIKKLDVIDSIILMMGQEIPEREVLSLVRAHIHSARRRVKRRTTRRAKRKVTRKTRKRKRTKRRK